MQRQVDSRKEAESARKQELADRQRTEGGNYRLTLPETPMAQGRVHKALEKKYKWKDGKISSVRHRLDTGEFVGKSFEEGVEGSRKYRDKLDYEAHISPTKFNKQRLADYDARLASKRTYSLNRADGTSIDVPKVLYDAVEFTTPQTETTAPASQAAATVREAKAIAVPRSKFGDVEQANAYAKFKIHKEPHDQVQRDLARVFKLKPVVVKSVMEKAYPMAERIADAKAELLTNGTYKGNFSPLASWRSYP